MLGTCFRGFDARVGDMWLEFNAFLERPGDYRSDSVDSVHILFLRVRLADGRSYLANTNSAMPGSIDLHVTTVSPRFIGRLTASLPQEGAPVAPPLELSLRFDVSSQLGCTL